MVRSVEKGRVRTGTYAEMIAITDVVEGDEFIINSGSGAGDEYEYKGSTAGWMKTKSGGSTNTSIVDNTQSGTTAQRDAAYPSPSGGETWDNTDLGYRQWYNPLASAWELDSYLLSGNLGVHVASNAALSEDRYIEYSQDGTGLSDNDVVWTSPDLRGYINHVFYVTVGSISVQGEMADGVWTGDLVGRQMNASSVGATFVNAPAAFSPIEIVGNYRRLRVLSNAAAAVTCYSKHSGGSNHG